jgi:polyphosphate kinase
MSQSLTVRQASDAEGAPPNLPAFPHLPFPVAGVAGDLLLDREFSLIEFYRRVLDEARDDSNPLLERVKFLSIVGTVVNEFVVTRYAALVGQQQLGPFGDAPKEKAHRKRVAAAIKNLLAEARLYLRDKIVPALTANGIHLVGYAGLQLKERAEVESYFTESVLPLLMPLGFDAARPFPHINGRTMALAVVVRHDGREKLACLQVPDAVPALVPFHRRAVAASDLPPRAALEQGFVWLHEVITEHVAAVFAGTEIVHVHPFRVFRSASLETETEEGVTLPEAIAGSLREREYGQVFSMMVSDTMPNRVIEVLAHNLAIPHDEIHVCDDFTDLAKLSELGRVDRPDLRDAPLPVMRRRPQGTDTALVCPGADGANAPDIFASIREGDILLHHPYESFQPVIDFVDRAASDRDVLAISTTLYRAGRNSPIVDALLNARRAGKQVRAVIELRARFDEENNLAWGKTLEAAGAHVVYGLVEHKVHAKLTLIARREAGRIRRYVHLSSGNYNPATSAVYTDLGVLSCDGDIGRDATDIFNLLSGYARPSDFRTLLVAPIGMRKRIKDLIDREASWARNGAEARMILKMNALADPEIIERLYVASQAGVRIDLIVRGICCLRPGVPGISDNIRVRSVVGRFLEHSRTWYFRNGGNEEIYLGSADLMERNLDERVEVMTPIRDARLKRRIHNEILGAYLSDNVKARELMPDGTYVRVRNDGNGAAINSQECLL